MTAPGPREYPARPVVGVGAVIVVGAGASVAGGAAAGGADATDRVVLVRRRFEPLAGQWSIPGGAVETGETLEAAAAREALEETGLAIDVGPVVEVFDRILRDDDGRVRYHFVLVDFLCRPVGGRLEAASDVAEVAIARSGELAAFGLTPKTDAVIRRALAMARGGGEVA